MTAPTAEDPEGEHIVRWRYDPELRVVAFRLYDSGGTCTRSMAILEVDHFRRLARSHPGSPLLAAVERAIDHRMVVAREDRASAAVLRLLGL